MSVQFLVHEDGDSVGVITVEGVKAGQELTGWIDPVPLTAIPPEPPPH